MNKLNRNILHTLQTAAALLLLAASSCTQEEYSPAEGFAPQGARHPVEIVATIGDGTGARIADDGLKTHWEEGDVIHIEQYVPGGLSLFTRYCYTADGKFVYQPGGSEEIYWPSTGEKYTFRGYYPDGSPGATTRLDRQDTQDIAYVLTGTGTAQYPAPIAITFEHQLAKIEVTLSNEQGNPLGEGYTVKLLNYDRCNHYGGLPYGANRTYIPMHYNKETGRFAAGIAIDRQVMDADEAFFQIEHTENGILRTTTAKLGKDTRFEQGLLYTYRLTLKKTAWHWTIDLATHEGSLTIDGGHVTLKGNGEETDTPVTVTDNATITLDNVNLTTEGTAITVNNGADLTLKVTGTNNSLVSKSGSGIGAYENSDICITGDGAKNSRLTVKAGNRPDDAPEEYANVGIGFLIGAYGKKSCGDILISDVTLDVATGNASQQGYNGAAIGLSGRWNWAHSTVTCGDIRITRSDVTCKLHETSTAACIGAGHWDADGDLEMGGIYIEGSTITATSGNKGDVYGACIGLGCVSVNKVTLKRIQIDGSTLNLTSGGENQVGKGRVYATATITEGIFVDGSDKGKEAWNP